MNDSEIGLIADRVLRSAFKSYGFERAEVRSGRDNGDEPAVYVDAVLGEGAPALSGSVVIDAHVALSHELLARGEERFPYLRTRRLGDELPNDTLSGPERD